MAKAYEPQRVEEKWQKLWAESQCFVADPKSKKPAFSIVMPPPNITGVLTLGHVLNNTVQDILARRARMTGHEVLWLPGTDHAGLSTQTVVEKALRKEEKITRHHLGREEFIRRTWEWREKHGNIIVEQLKRLGCSCDWTRQRFTLDEDYVEAVQQVFVDLYKKGYIYRGLRMVNWDPAALTAISDEEVEMKPQNGLLYHVRYELVDEPENFLIVATTRPETIMGDTALAVHPQDPRYKHLIGKKVYRPFPREAIPIIGDEAIDMQFGSGILKVTPAHDKVDFEIGQRHQLPARDILHPTGKMHCPDVPELDGMDRFEARKRAQELLEARGALVKIEPHQNSVGFSERSQVPIEPRLSEQWFLRYPKTKEALAVVREGLIRFFPSHWEKVYAQWLENIQDWCISRQVWWGHRIPAWYRKEEVRVQIESPGPEWEQDPDTLDTWFSSWLWAFETMDEETRKKFYPTDVLVTAPDIIFFWVARMIIAGLEYLPGKTEEPKENIPFRNVYFTGLIRDKNGRKMSKSLGNSPDVLEMIGRFGADGTRFGLLRIAPLGHDIRFDEKQIEEGRNFANKIWNAVRFYQMQELNVPFGVKVSYRPAPYVLDIEAKLHETTRKVEAAYKEFKFNEVAQLLYDFFWKDYCDWFVEAAKVDIQGGDVHPMGGGITPTGEFVLENESGNKEAGAITEHAINKRVALFTMYRVLTEFLRLLHPFMPHLTEELSERLVFPPRQTDSASAAPKRKSQFLMNQQLGNPIGLSGSKEEVAAGQKMTAQFYETVSAARTLRAEYGVVANKQAKFILRLHEEILDEIEQNAWPFAACLRVLTRMINAEELILNPDYQPKKGTPSALTPLGDLFMPLEGLVDLDAERSRLQKEIMKTEGDLHATIRKLQNEQFVENAPEAVVTEHRQRQVDLQKKLEKLKAMLEALG